MTHQRTRDRLVPAGLFLLASMLSLPVRAQVALGGTTGGTSGTTSATGTGTIAIGGGASPGAGATANCQGCPVTGAAVAVGAGSQATAEASTALGTDATADATDATALGSGGTGSSATATTASGTGATAIGGNATAGAKASGTNSIAIGGQASATQTSNIAIGVSAASTGSGSLALGAGSQSLGTGSFAIGTSADAGNAIATFALGDTATATNNGSMAVGDGANSSGNNALAIGNTAHASGSHATGIGSDATGSGAYATAVGAYASASGAGATAIGADATSGATATGANSVAVGGQSVANNAGDVAIGLSASATGVAGVGSATSIGNGNTARGAGAVAIGDPSVANGTGAFAGGFNSIATGNGTGAGGPANGAVAIGNADIAFGQGSVALGNTSTTGGAGAIAVGDTSVASAAGSIALGSGSVANNAGDVALGSGSTTAAAVATPGITLNGTSYSFAGTTPTSTVSIGSPVNARTLTNVAAGQISATSTDAVNGSELYATNQALVNLQSTVSSGGVGPVRYSSAAAPTTPNGGTPSQDLTLVGAAAGPVSLHNVAAGQLSATSTDAINGSQLYATNQEITTLAIGVSSGSVGPVQYSNATSPTTPNGGTASQDLTLVGASAGAVTLHNVAAGVAPTDAADVGQLNTAVGTLGNAINKLGSSTASDLGGGATYDATTGAVSAPSYVVGNSTYQNTGAAIAAINATLSQLAGNGLVQQTNGPHGQITIGAGTGGTVVSVAGADGNRRITGVAPGAVTANSTQAVNGAQLYQVENELNQSLGADVVRNAYGAAASAMSQAGMPQSYEAGRSMIAMGAGSTGGQSALAFGISRITDNGRWVMKLNGSMSTTSKGGVGGGIGYQW